ARAVREVHVEQTRARVIWREGHREQPALAARDHRARDVGERPPPTSVRQANPAALLDDDQARDPRCGGDIGRLMEAPDPLELQARLCPVGRRRDRQTRGGDQRQRRYCPFSSNFCSWFPAWPMMSLGLIGTTWPASLTRVCGGAVEIRTTNSPSGTDPSAVTA